MRSKQTTKLQTDEHGRSIKKVGTLLPKNWAGRLHM